MKFHIYIHIHIHITHAADLRHIPEFHLSHDDDCDSFAHASFWLGRVLRAGVSWLLYNIRGGLQNVI